MGKLKIYRGVNNIAAESYDFAALAGASNTRRAYASDWKHFVLWCSRKNFAPLPAEPDKLASYLRFLAERLKLKSSTVSRRLAAISQMHKKEGFTSPASEWVVKNTLIRIRKEAGVPLRSKKPLLVNEIKEMILRCPPTLTGIRDKAILLLGFAGALKRSELISLNVDDIFKAKEGLVLIVNGRKIGIPFGQKAATCPVKAVTNWLRSAAISDGPLFRKVNKFSRCSPNRLTDRYVSEIVKRYCKIIGKRPAHFSAHSLRAGFATSAAIAGASESSIQRQTGHKSLAVLRRYTKDSDLFKDHAFIKLGL